jgi:hypothetical protein
MTTTKNKTDKRRGVSKARLLKELRLVMVEHDLLGSNLIADLDNAIQVSIVDEAMAK